MARTMTASEAVRYAGVLAVWTGLFLVRPRLAMEVMRERRVDSPLPRWPYARRYTLALAWPAV